MLTLHRCITIILPLLLSFHPVIMHCWCSPFGNLQLWCSHWGPQCFCAHLRRIIFAMYVKKHGEVSTNKPHRWKRRLPVAESEKGKLHLSVSCICIHGSKWEFPIKRWQGMRKVPLIMYSAVRTHTVLRWNCGEKLFQLSEQQIPHYRLSSHAML